MKKKLLTPYTKIILIFIGVILFGAVLLCLPCSTTEGSMGFTNAFFMSTSALCVTGLTVISNLAIELTLFGKIVIICLVEIGGLGFITLVVFFMMVVGSKIGITDRLFIKEALNLNSVKGIVKTVRFIVVTTLTIQFIGAIFIFFAIRGNYATLDAVGISIFHAISAFNNAGFDIFGASTSMQMYTGDVFLNIITMVLIIMGGIGFLVILDILKNKNWKNLSLSTKIVLPTTLVLIFGGALLLKLSMGSGMSLLQAFFQSVSARTAGFATIDMNSLSNGGFITMCLLMFIGGAPCSTAGGIKVSTFFIIVATLFMASRGKSVHAYKRRIAMSTIVRAFCLIVFSIMFICSACLLISIFDPELSLKNIIFEVFSAFGTVGVSMGITTSLSVASKYIICLSMFFGKIGPLTIMSIWNANWMAQTKNSVEYPEEKLLIG